MIWLLLGLALLVGVLLLFTAVGTAVVNARYPHNRTSVSVGAARIHADVRGRPRADRPSLVFVHGASSNFREFVIAVGDHLESRFGAHQHVIFVDRPGHGGSSRHAGDYSPKVQALRIMDAARSLGATSVVAVGHSWGGAVVAQMAVERDDFVRGAVFCAPATHPWPGERFEGVDWFYAVADTPFIGWLFTRMITLPVAWSQIDEGVENVFSPEPSKPGYAKALGARLLLRPKTFRANAEDVHRLRAFVIEHWRAYSSITCPVAIVTGDADRVVWPSIHSDGLERDIAGARKTVIAGGGHMPHQTHPQLVLDAIEDVLSR